MPVEVYPVGYSVLEIVILCQMFYSTEFGNVKK